MSKYSIIDFETTGFGSYAKILEIGAIRVDEHLNFIGEDDFGKFSSEIDIRTLVEWPKNHISGIVREKGLYSEREAVDILVEFTKDSTIVGYNLNFEERILRRFGVGITRKMDVMEILRKRFPLVNGKYSLDEYCKAFNVKRVAGHTALGDCVAVYDLLKEVTRQMEKKEKI